MIHDYFKNFIENLGFSVMLIIKTAFYATYTNIHTCIISSIFSKYAFFNLYNVLLPRMRMSEINLSLYIFVMQKNSINELLRFLKKMAASKPIS